MRLTASLLTLVLTIPLFADLADEVRKTEIAFARAFADRDKATFFSFVADDATFFGFRTSQGKQQVIERWTRYFEGPEAPFSWTPERVSVSADGKLGLSTGPVHLPDGTHTGDYVSTWRRESDGTWKIVFDSSGPGPAVLPEHVPPHEEGFVTANDGTQLYYRRIGNGRQTIIAPLDFVMHPLLRQFSDLATIITYDMRNRGKSGQPKDVNTLTIDQDVKDLEDVRAHFKIEKFIPVGFSYLGKMVAMYAAEHPHRVQRVIQMGPSANRDEITGTQQAVEDFGAPAEVIKKWQDMRGTDAVEKTPKEFCLVQGEMFRYFLTGTPKGAARYDVARNCELENEWPVNFMRHLQGHWASARKAVLSPEEMKKIAVPVLVIHGTKDRNAPYAGGQAWAAELPNARLVSIEGAAHSMWLDDPPAVFAAIRQFLRGE